MEQIARLWLRTQCRMMAGLCHAVVVLEERESGAAMQDSPAARIVAVWPEGDTLPPAVRDACMRVMQNRQAVFSAGTLPQANAEGETADILGAPVLMDGEVVGAVAVAIVSGDATRQRLAYHALKLGCAWFEGLVKAEATAVAGRLSNVLETVACTLEHPRFESAASALVNTLCTRLHCSRASIGWLRGGQIKVGALSHSATFQVGSTLVRCMGSAMQETVRRRAVVRWDANSPDAAGFPEHGRLAAEHEDATLCSVPVTHDTRLLGVVLLERNAASHFSDDEVDVCEAALALAGPILELKHERSSMLGGLGHRERAPRRISRWLRRVAIGGAIAAAAIAACVVEWDFRIAASARLEGSVQRTVVATQDGYVSEALVRAGDAVKTGDLLVRLDDKDLKVEAQKWGSRRRQLEKEYRDALAQHDRAQVSILRAQMDEAEAEAALARAQLERTRLRAPFDGMVVAGDLSQSLGAPVERGEVLFELAPLADYRVVLEVDERDVAYLSEGQRGELVLTALPHALMEFTVTRLTPVASTDATSHHFRVEAMLDRPDPALRPGMEGVGKVWVGERPLAWTWSRRLQDWMRLLWWRWMP